MDEDVKMFKLGALESMAFDHGVLFQPTGVLTRDAITSKSFQPRSPVPTQSRWEKLYILCYFNDFHSKSKPFLTHSSLLEAWKLKVKMCLSLFLEEDHHHSAEAALLVKFWSNPPPIPSDLYQNY